MLYLVASTNERVVMSKFDEQGQRIAENYKYLMQEWEEDGIAPSFSEWEEIFEDRDPFEFI